MSYANVKAFILILVVMAVPAVIWAAPAGFQAPSVPMPSIPSAMQAPFMGGRDTNSRGQGQFGGSNSNRGPFGGQQMSGMADIGIDPKDFGDSRGSGPMAVPSGFNDLGLGDMMGKNGGAPDASGMRREFDALVRSVGTMESNGMSSRNIQNIGFKPTDFNFIPGRAGMRL